MEPPPTSVLFIGRASAKESKALVGALAKKATLHTAISGKAALALADRFRPRVIVLDAVTMRTTGERVCKALRGAAPQAVIIRLMAAGEHAASPYIDQTLTHPVSARKLLSHVQRHLHPPKEEVISAGPLSLNIERRILTAWGQETQLNPKLAELFGLLLRHPNHTLDRATLMRAVWQTEYIDDTRTLNVHISHARQILESNGHPRLIQTVRGIGYRLEVPPAG